MELGEPPRYDGPSGSQFIFEGAPIPLPCCYSAAARLRSTHLLSLASSAAHPNVGADGGQLHPLAAAKICRRFCLKADS